MTLKIRILLAGGIVLLALSGALYQTLRLQFGERAAYVHVRWAPTLDPAVQEQIERAHGLWRVEFRGEQTWAYYLSDLSFANIRRLVAHPAVADTHEIDRTAFQIAPTAVRGPYFTGGAAWIARMLEFFVRVTLAAGVASLIAAAAIALQIDTIVAVLLLGALLLRLFLAYSEPYIHDEENTHIPLSKTISFEPGQLRLPLRGENHGALPAYIVHASSALFGTTPLAYRALHVVLSLITLVLVYLLARQWYGTTAARWAVALMAFNEYVLTRSARANAVVPLLFFVTVAIYAFGQFLAAKRAVYLYVAGVAVGLAFYTKEHAALLLPVFFLVLLQAPYRHWLRRPHPYLACALFVLVIGPDLLWNVRTDPDAVYVTYSGTTVGQATYEAHLERIGGIGFSPYPAMFYARGLVSTMYRLVTGVDVSNAGSESPHSINSALGLLLIVAMLWAIVRAPTRDALRIFLLLLAGGIFIFFTLIEPGDPPFRLSPVNWVWVESTLVPVVILAGAGLASVTGRWRYAAWTLAAVTLLFAVDSVLWGVA